MTTHLTTHILDASTGVPATGVGVVLADVTGGVVAEGNTDSDGRLALGPEILARGDYALTFATGAYFSSQGVETFYPSATVTFTVTDERHYHVPLLLSPFAYSTYRGS
ncbi:5-hydroxyisourate hydrolase [Microbacterium endophyticum]|uniref:5-hydroxyisourate hydrolase n=1 Tax=Microbacterium endophyticum TaxID=1526412 RepID=A0A7W4V5A3_9MICO|nr:hydroxyisourate hydrolase [Microbacterium endophyticum]MBB2977116.1 5-hydroxyisourate hydrolase [Microbacterium endophyticum]NIK36044.1 5-hydroxyisourate hydrolase [Microbacterium endophyticum]